ncbi:MAG: hypothetical protein AAF741_11865 [Bacteroidota bacterium]
MHRLILILLGLSFSWSVRADGLGERLDLILPQRGTERQYVETRMRQLISELESDRVGKRKLSKQLQWIRQRVDGGYLRKYKSVATLPDMFRERAYSDVTAALVYGMVLEHFELAYQIVIDHWEVYLLVGDKERPVSLRDLSGRASDKQQELAFRQDYIELLNLTALPAQRPRSAAQADSLYNIYHYADRELLSFHQLAAHYHYRRSMEAYRHGNLERSVELLAQARHTDDRPAFDLLEQATYLQLAQGAADSTDLASLFYLFELWRNDRANRFIPRALMMRFRSVSDRSIQTFAGGQVPQDPMAKGVNTGLSFPSFGRSVEVSDPIPLTGSDLEAGWAPAEQLYLYLDSRANDFPAWRDTLQELYYFQRGRYYYLRNRDDLVLEYLDSLHRLRPTDTLYRESISALSVSDIRAEGLTGEALAERIEDLIARYPYLAEDPALADLMLEDLAKTIRTHFSSGNTMMGERSLVEFRRALSRFDTSLQRRIWVLEVFASASYHYYMLADFDRARDMLREGLRYAPGEVYLTHRLELLGQ